MAAEEPRTLVLLHEGERGSWPPALQLEPLFVLPACKGSAFFTFAVPPAATLPKAATLTADLKEQFLLGAFFSTVKVIFQPGFSGRARELAV